MLARQSVQGNANTNELRIHLAHKLPKLPNKPYATSQQAPHLHQSSRDVTMRKATLAFQTAIANKKTRQAPMGVVRTSNMNLSPSRLQPRSPGQAFETVQIAPQHQMRLMESSNEDPNSFRVETKIHRAETDLLNGFIVERTLESAEPDLSEQKVTEATDDIRLTPPDSKMPTLPKLPHAQVRQQLDRNERPPDYLAQRKSNQLQAAGVLGTLFLKEP